MSPSRHRPAAGPHILVVDDDAAIARQIALWIADVGIAYEATTTMQALAIAKVIRIDLAIIDLLLPRMDGFALAAALRRDRGDSLPVIFMTGQPTVAISRRGVDAHASELLYKPLDESQLRDAVTKALPAGRVKRRRGRVC